VGDYGRKILAPEFMGIISMKSDKSEPEPETVSEMDFNVLAKVRRDLEVERERVASALEANTKLRKRLSEVIHHLDNYDGRLLKLEIELVNIRNKNSWIVYDAVISIVKNPLNINSILKRAKRRFREGREEKRKFHSGFLRQNELPMAAEKRARPKSVFVDSSEVLLRNVVSSGEIYVLTGLASSLDGAVNDRGVLLSIEVRDISGNYLRVASDQVSYVSEYNRSIVFLKTGPVAKFALIFGLPDNAHEVTLRVVRFNARGKVHLLVNPLKKRSAIKRSVADAGVTAIPDDIGLTVLNTLEKRSDETKNRNKLCSMPVILDEFTFECFEPDAALIEITKKNWRSEIEEIENPLAFFAESSWRGNGNEWKYAMTKPGKWGGALKDCINHCKENSIPTVFWNKEDPANFDVFLETAKQFDYIFTTDAGCVQRYRDVVGHENVHLLMFAAQAALQNPIRQGEQIQRFAFTGSWRGVKYPKRAEWIDTLLTPAMEMQVLDIFDRYADEKQNPDLIFPDKYKPALRGALDYKNLIELVYKKYLGFISVNSVENSDTMLARRVYEMLACGAPVISSPSRAIENIFGDVVLMPDSSVEAQACMAKLLDEPIWREGLVTRGVRKVHSEHTYKNRLEEIAQTLGKPIVSKSTKKVSIVCCSKRPHFLEHVGRQIRAQSHQEYELVFVKHNSTMQDEEVERHLGGLKNLTVLHNEDHKVLADGLNQAISIADGDYIAKWDDDDYYGPEYLKDALLAFDYAPHVGVVGKGTYFAYVQSTDRTYLRFPGKQYRITDRVHGGTILWDRKKTGSIGFTPTKQGTDTLFLRDCKEAGVQIFSIDPFNFVHIRYDNNSDHTWRIQDEEFIRNATLCGSTLDLNYVYL
jgi:spore maturation protein CgeB